MSKKIELSETESGHLREHIYVTVEGDKPDESFRNTYDTREEAVDNNVHAGTLVATYKLVKLEVLSLKRTTRVVKVKP